jgi:D-glycerate 3-kinase
VNVKNNALQEVVVTQRDTQSEHLNSTIERFICKHKLPSEYAKVAQKWFAPLALRLIQHQSGAGKPIIVGVNGCQGSGKSTLSALLICFLTEVYKVSSIAFSIDDFYLSKKARETLSESINPLLSTRGVPGTHDIVLLENVLKALSAGKAVKVPVFDKSTDNIRPSNEWVSVTQAYDIIILEGWCVGVDSQHPSQLIDAVNALESKEDASGEWRRYVNDMLSVDYARVFSSIDYLIMLQAPSFDHVYTWRCEQEHKLIAFLQNQEPKGVEAIARESLKTQNDMQTTLAAAKGVMSDQEILRFIQFYQRLTQHALTSMPAKCDSLYTLDEKRNIKQCVQR